MTNTERLADAMRGCLAEVTDAALMLKLIKRPSPHTIERYLTHVRLLSQHIETWRGLTDEPPPFGLGGKE